MQVKVQEQEAEVQGELQAEPVVLSWEPNALLLGYWPVSPAPSSLRLSPPSVEVLEQVPVPVPSSRMCCLAVRRSCH